MDLIQFFSFKPQAQTLLVHEVKGKLHEVAREKLRRPYLVTKSVFSLDQLEISGMDNWTI